MREAAFLLFCACLIAGCSNSHVFEVSAEGAESARLTLYGGVTDLERDGQGFTGRRSGADGSGNIEVVYPDGRRVTCAIGYVTNNDPEPHRFVVRDGRCHAI